MLKLVHTDRPWRLLSAALVAYAALFVLALKAPLGLSMEAQTVIADVGMLPAGLAVSILAFRAGLQGDAPPGVRRAWLWLALSFLSFCVGDLIYAYLELVALNEPSPSLADIAYLAYYPLLLVGLLSFPLGIATRDERVRFVLDALTVALGGAMVVWYFVLGPTVSLEVGDVTETALAVGYPVGDLVLLLGVGVISVQRALIVSRPVGLLLIAGLLVGFAADLVYGMGTLTTGALAGGDADLLYMLAWPLLGGAAYLAYGSQPRSVPKTRSTEPDSIPLLPYLSVALGYGMLVVAVRDAWSTTLVGLVVGAGCLTALVVARQISTVRENLRLAAHQARQKTEARFRSLVQNASDVIVVVDRDGRIGYVTPSVTRTLGYEVTDVSGSLVHAFIPADDHRLIDELLASVIDQPHAGRTVELRLMRSDGRPLVVEASIVNLVDDPDIGGYVVTVRNVDDRKKLEVKLAHQAFHDPLTGLANRALFMSSAAAELVRARARDYSMGMLYLDIDGFKTINDSLGHAAGDRALVEVARRIRHAVRGRDLVGRVGGDEFAVLLSGAATTEAAGAVSGRILRALAAPYTLDSQEVAFSASIGISLSGSVSEDADEVLRNADIAMYLAKMRGKARYAFFEQGMQLPAVERLELVAGLRHALTRAEFTVHYQPIVELASGRTMGSEALLRWQRGDNDLVLPGKFISYAEESGQIVAIGRWVLEQVCAELAQPSAAPGFVSVNVSASQLSEPQFALELARIIELTGLDPARLVLEVTESVVMSDPEMTIERLRALKDLGVRIAVDDFGTGYSSLAYLRRLPVDEVKIDRSFIADMDRSAGAALVNGIVSMSHTLGLQCIAEGIETQAQADALRVLGCDLAQGFFFGHPAPRRA